MAKNTDNTASCDVLIVGAGPVGAIAARELAEAGYHCLVIDKRDHVAGNCFDQKDAHGILLHRYGPHYFRTNDDSLKDYLSKFTDWVPGQYVVKSQVQGELYPFPINLDTLEKFFKLKLTESTAAEFLNQERSHEHPNPQNSEEFVLSRVGRRLYEAFYLGYTLKQWDRHPRELDASVCGRIPVRFNRFDRYVDHKHQIMPKNGFTELFQNVLRHEKIEIRKRVDFLNSKKDLRARFVTLYTGPIDEYFEFSEGKLPWRSLEFDFRNFTQEYVQPCVQINYPDKNIPYTRTVEIKHATGQKAPSTTVCYEYPRASGDPYYPVPSAEGRSMYRRYKTKADLEKSKGVLFAGRLAEYTYINTDQAIERGLQAAKEALALIRQLGGSRGG